MTPHKYRDVLIEESNLIRLAYAHLSADQVKSLTYADWKDGIDITRATHQLQTFARALTEFAERQPAEQEPVATLLASDPYDEREGIWFSLADRKRLMALPAGTKLYTFLGEGNEKMKTPIHESMDS